MAREEGKRSVVYVLMKIALGVVAMFSVLALLMWATFGAMDYFVEGGPFWRLPVGCVVWICFGTFWAGWLRGNFDDRG